ncbi:MAG: hypothetical protein ACQEWM_13030 [Actinomycetota bacterium]
MPSTKTGPSRLWATDPLGLRAVVSSRSARTLLLILLGTDLFYIVRHIVAVQTDGSFLHFLNTGHGYPEAFQTLQWLWCIGLLLLMVVVLRRWAYAALLPLFAFLLLTDTFGLHERYGRELSEALGLEPAFGLRAQDFGEMIVFVGAALVTIPIALAGLWLASRVDRRHFLRIAGLLAVLIFFGVVLDAVHIIVGDGGDGDVFNLLEDGGEMIAASLLVAYLFWLQVTGERAGASASSSTRETEALRAS